MTLILSMSVDFPAPDGAEMTKSRPLHIGNDPFSSFEVSVRRGSPGFPLMTGENCSLHGLNWQVNTRSAIMNAITCVEVVHSKRVSDMLTALSNSSGPDVRIGSRHARIIGPQTAPGLK